MNSVKDEFPEIFEAISQGASIRYSASFREFTIPLLSEDGGSLILRYCPFSGKTLPYSLREEWFDQVERLKLFPVGSVFDWNDPAIPHALQTEEWWRKQRL